MYISELLLIHHFVSNFETSGEERERESEWKVTDEKESDLTGTRNEKKKRQK
jgi:hypothetical protein